MDNLDILVILGTQDTGRRKQNKTKTQHNRENKKMSNTNQPNKGSTSSCSRFKITTNNINVKQNKRYKYETV